jgi:L-lactate dehydrogenase complex protein LldG
MENRDAFMQTLPGSSAAPHPSAIARYACSAAEKPLCRKNSRATLRQFHGICLTDDAGSLRTGSLATLPQVAEGLCNQYGGGPVLISGDARLANAGITAHLQRSFPAHCWASPGREDNLRNAAAANIGVVFAEYGLCETGGVVLFSSPLQGRAISLLPRRRCLLSTKPVTGWRHATG